MDPRITTHAHGHLGLIARPSLVQIGLSDRQIGHLVHVGRLERLHPVVFRVAGSPPFHDQALLAACWAASRVGVASHRSAAWLWGLDGPFAETVEISVPRLVKARPKGVVVHRSRDLVDDHVAVRRGVPLTKPARTLVDLGAVVRQHILDRAVDDALVKRLVSLDGLLEMLEEVARRGRPGVGRLRASLAARTDAPESVLEAEFQRLIRRFGLPEPIYQYELRDPSGRFVGRIDGVYEPERLAIELDGSSSRNRLGQLARDNVRQNLIVECGFQPVRFVWAQVVGAPEKVAADLERLLARRRAELGLSLHK